MTDDEQIFTSHFSRRGFLATACAVGAGIAAGPLLGGTAEAAPMPQSTPAADPVWTPRVGGLHLQFGVDASSEVVVSWHSRQPVGHPRVLLGGTDGRFERTVAAATTSYTDAKSGHAQHARVGRLRPDTEYVYAAVHDGAQAELGTRR